MTENPANTREASSLSGSDGDLFSQLIVAAPDGMIVVVSAGGIALVNAQTERLFGYSREQLLGESVEKLIPKRHRPQHVHYRTGYGAAPKLRSMGSGLELYG